LAGLDTSVATLTIASCPGRKPPFCLLSALRAHATPPYEHSMVLKPWKVLKPFEVMERLFTVENTEGG
jgi:hypothetical protein